MKKSAIPLITMAVFSILILSSVDFVIRPAIAQASSVTVADINLGAGNNTVFAMESLDLFVFVSNTGDRLSWVQSDRIITTSNVRSIIVEPYVGGCNAVDNPCGDNGSGLEIFGNIETAEEAFWIGNALGIWCGVTDCFTWYVSTNSTYPHQIHRYTKVGTADFVLSGYMNVSATTFLNPRQAMSGYDSTSGGIGGVTLFVTVFQSAVGQRLLRIGGTSLMQTVASMAIGGSNVDIVSMDSCNPVIDGMELCPVGGRVALTWRQTVSTFFQIWELNTNTNVCTSASLGTTDTANDQTVYNKANNRWYLSLDSASPSIQSATISSCVPVAVTGSTYGAYIAGLAFDTTATPDLFYVYDNAEQTTPRLRQFSLDTVTTISAEDFDTINGNTISGWTSGANAPSQSLAIDNNSHVIAITGDTSAVRILYLTNFVEPVTPPSQGVDCTLPENANILICRLGGDGTLGSAGAFVIGNTTDGTGILGIGCSIGLVDCTVDDNPQTNGLGLLIFVASIFIVVGMFVRSLGAEETVRTPTFVWVIIIMALSAFFTITGIIDPVFLILSVVALIALGAPKLVGMIKGGTTFGQGSTE